MRLLAIASQKTKAKAAKDSLSGSPIFGINRITRSLATPARYSRGRVQERVQGDTACRRRFPLHPLCKLRRGSPPSNPRSLSGSRRFRSRHAGSASLSLSVLGISTTRFAAAEAPPTAAPCSGGGPRKPRAAAILHDPRPLGASSTMLPAAPASRSRTASRLRAYRRSLCLAKPSIPPFRLAPRGAFHFVYLCTLPTCRKGRGKPSASRKLKPFGFPLSPLRLFGASASSTA